MVPRREPLPSTGWTGLGGVGPGGGAESSYLYRAQQGCLSCQTLPSGGLLGVVPEWSTLPFPPTPFLLPQEQPWLLAKSPPSFCSQLAIAGEVSNWGWGPHGEAEVAGMFANLLVPLRALFFKNYYY